jgi:hypothetical protein
MVLRSSSCNFFLAACCGMAVSAYETLNIANVSMPESNGPLNTTLAYYRLAASSCNGAGSLLSHAFIPVGCGANMSVHYTEPSVWGRATGTDSKPVLILTHGYPESSYIWRRTTGPLSERVPLLVVDVGLSTLRHLPPPKSTSQSLQVRNVFLLTTRCSNPDTVFQHRAQPVLTS